jgi:hypothetical protein
MKQERAPFRPLTPEIDDNRLEQLARDKGVGVLARPAKTVQAPPQVLATLDVEVPTISVSATNDTGATPRSRMKTVNLELPDYVWTEIKIRAVQRQTSLRHVVMTALLADGITITDVDMVEDGRRLRGNSSGS